MPTLALVVVTYNRSNLLINCLNSIFSGSVLPDKVYVVNNASTDNTLEVLREFQNKWDEKLQVIDLKTNIGGAGGFEVGTRLAYNDGVEWFGLLDDDVLLGVDCLRVISNHINTDKMKKKCMIAVRENLEGYLEEYCAIKVDYRNPFKLNPKVSTISEQYSRRENLPEILEITTASFEGFFVCRDIFRQIGFPKREFFIFGDDTDFSLRIKKSGNKLYAIRDAKVIRQLPFQKYKNSKLKSYYRWRNFFVLHLLYGENFLVRAKPYIFTLIFGMVCVFNKKYPNFLLILRDAIALAKLLKYSKQNIDGKSN